MQQLNKELSNVLQNVFIVLTLKLILKPIFYQNYSHLFISLPVSEQCKKLPNTHGLVCKKVSKFSSKKP